MNFFKKIILFIFYIIALIVLVFVLVLPIFQKKTIPDSFSNPTPTDFISTSSATISIITPTISPTITPKIISSKPISSNIISDDTIPWGIAQQVGEHTWTMKVGQDSTMASPLEILDALNNYRVNHGSQRLSLDQKLVDYAQSRANFFIKNNGLDSHQGFNNFLEKEDGFTKLGYTWVGENASLGYQLNGVHLIEWIYAGDEAHDKNQLDTRWDHVGIGVAKTATCLIFATGKM